MKKTLSVIGLLAFAATASAQVIVHEHDGQAAKEQHVQVLMEKAVGTGVHVSVEVRPVTGAPYSAETVRESIQVLADGNRIVRRSASRVYRDGKGRTRREDLGPDGQVLGVTISDPAGGGSVVLDPAANTAHRTGVATFVSSTGVAERVSTERGVTIYYAPESKQHAELKVIKEAQLGAKQEAEQKTAQQTGSTVHVTASHATINTAGAATWVAAGAGGPASAASKQDLGEQMMEGVAVKGTRTTTVIPAGAFGNELPITVTSEEWFSPDLQVLVMTKHADPRTGETTYRLTDITRSEPDPSLFQLPAGVTIK